MSGQQILAVCQGKMDLKCQGKMDFKFVRTKVTWGLSVLKVHGVCQGGWDMQFIRG